MEGIAAPTLVVEGRDGRRGLPKEVWRVTADWWVGALARSDVLAGPYTRAARQGRLADLAMRKFKSGTDTVPPD